MKFSFLNQILFAAAALLYAPLAIASFELGPDWEIKPGCENFFADLGIHGPVIPRRSLNVSEMSATDHFPLYQFDQGYDPKAAYIGVSNGNDATEGSHHYYLIVGKRRAEVSPLYGKPMAMKGRMATKGVLFKLPLPPEVLAAIEARVKAEKIPRGLTCLHPVCEILRDAGVEIEGAEKGKSVRTKVVSASLLQGKVKVNGQALDPQTMELLESHDGELVEYLSTAATADAGMRARIIEFVAPRASGVLVVGGFTGFLIYKHRELEAEKASKAR